MAADRIEVVFEAAFDDLVAGVRRVSDAITSLTAPVQRLDTGFTTTFGQAARVAPAAALATGREWQSALNVIDRSLDTMLKGVLQGTQSWQQAMARLFSNIALAFIEAVVKMMVQWAAFEALTAIMGASPIANPFGGGAGGMGTAGGGAGSSGLGTVLMAAMHGVGSILGFASGSWSVPADMLAVVHQGEMIIPANAAAALRAGTATGDMAASAGSSFALNVTVQAMDAAGVAQWANANAKTLAATIARYMSANPSARGDY